MRKFILIYILFITCGCERYTDLKELTGDPTVRISVQGVTQFTYSPLNCQLGFCRKKCEFRAHTDNMSDYFTLTLDKIPTSVSEYVEGDIVWTGASSLEQRQEVALKVIKLEGDIIWLWDKQSEISAVVKVLE